MPGIAGAAAARSRTRPPQLLAQLRESFRHPEFWSFSSWLDIVTRYRRNRLGLLWLFAPVLMFTFALAPIYSTLFGRELSVFIVHLGMGYAVWRMIVMVINDAITSFRSNKALILDGHTRLTDYTLRSLAKATFYLCASMVGMVGILLWSPAVEWYAIPWLLVAIPVVLMNLFWLAYVIGILGARSPDFGEVLHTALMVGFLFTPILWEGERFPADSLGGLIVRLNPAYHLLELVRAPLFGRAPEFISVVYVSIMTVVGWLAAIFLCRRYGRFVPIWI